MLWFGILCKSRSGGVRIDDWVSSSFNAGLGILTIDDEFEEEVAAVGGFDQVSEFFANYIHKLSEKVEMGVELSYGERENFDGTDGDNTRLQFSGKYSF